MSSLSYAVEKLVHVVEGLAGGADMRALLDEAWVPLDALTDLPLTETTLEPVLTLIQSLGLEHKSYPVPIRMPVPVRGLPDSRLKQIARLAVSALVAVASEAGAVGQKAIPRAKLATAAEARRLRYRHLGWEAHRESTEYLAFLRQAFPNYPLDVLQEWFRRHGYQGMELAGNHVDLERLFFRQEQWTAERVATLTARSRDFLEVGPDSFGGTRLDEPEDRRRRDWLVFNMAQAGTWPVAPIVLEDGVLAPSAEHAAAGRPYLLEGHRRTALLLNLAERGRAGKEHLVWVAAYRGDELSTVPGGNVTAS